MVNKFPKKIKKGMYFAYLCDGITESIDKVIDVKSYQIKMEVVEVRSDGDGSIKIGAVETWTPDFVKSAFRYLEGYEIKQEIKDWLDE